MNTVLIHVYQSYSYLLVGGLEEVWGEGKRDSNIRLFSMGILRTHRKVPMLWLQGDSEFPFGAFLLSGNEIFLKLINFLF